MTLTKERRNEIAWVCLLDYMISNKIDCGAMSTIIALWLNSRQIKKIDNLTRSIGLSSFIFAHTNQLSYCQLNIKDQVEETQFAWEVFVAKQFKEGVVLNSSFTIYRVLDEDFIKKSGLSNDDAISFVAAVLEAVSHKTIESITPFIPITTFVES